MSNSLAIAAVTATLQRMLDDTSGGLTAHLPPDIPNSLGLSTVSVTMRPPDKARDQNDNTNQVNIFLYQTMPNAALRNMDMPQQVRPGETAQPPVALTLHYLLSAYGKDNNETAAHILLGQAMRIFHDNAVLDQQAIKDALVGNDLYEQIERVRLTQFPLSLEEISKLWTAFQTQYRISAAYQAEVVLIESTRPARAPLPVLARGAKDTGAVAQPDLIPPFPTLTAVRPDVQPPGSETSAVLGNDLLVSGHDLDGTNVSVEVSHPRLQNPIPLPAPSNATATAITVNLPNQPQNLPAGIYTISVSVIRPGETSKRTTNALPFAVASQILPNPAINAARNGSKITITLACNPEVLPAQRVALLLGGDEVPAEAHDTQTGNLTFIAKDDPPGKFAAGDYFVRLRVDGVDSLLIDRSVQPPQFKTSQKVTIP